RVLRKKEERPAETTVLGVESGDQLRLGLGQVKGSAVRLRNHRHRKDEEGDQPQWKELQDEPCALGLLRLHNSDHAQRAYAIRTGASVIQSPAVERGHQDRRYHG